MGIEMENKKIFDWFNPSIGCAKISIASYGIKLSKNTMQIMGKPNFIKLGYNKHNNLLCIKITDKEDANKISLENAQAERYTRINIKDFISILNTNNNNVFSIKTYKFIGIWDEELKELIVDLNKSLLTSKESDEDENE